MITRALLFGGILLGSVAPAGAQGVYFGGVRLFNGGPQETEIYGYLGPNMTGGYAYASFLIDSSLNLGSPAYSLGGIGISCNIVDQDEVVDNSDFQANPYRFPYQLTVDKPFLIGIQMGRYYINSNGQGAFEVTRFGWARLEYTTTGLTLLDSAMAYDGLPIVAGTTTVLPEPSSIAIALSAMIGLALLCRRFTPASETAAVGGRQDR